MKITELKRQQNIIIPPKLDAAYAQFNALINELNTRGLPDNTISAVNEKIEDVISTTNSGKSIRRQIQKNQAEIVKLIENKHKIVPKNYYRNVWLALGMTAFGIPIGAAIGISVGNMGLLAVGLPIGIAFGMIVGIRMDNNALKEGRQLDIELK